MIIDTHAHLNFKAYKDDLSETIKRSLDNNIWLINVGSEFETSEKAIKIAEKYDQGVYASIGLHPIHVQNEFNYPNKVKGQEEIHLFAYQQYKKLAQNQKVVAIGETGLDFKKEYLFLKEKQIQVFLNHLKLAKELDLPIIFHCRLAHQEVIEILKKQEKRQGVIHCFTGDWTAAEEYLKIGLYLGFNGIIFKLNLDETIKKTPLDRILVETDCPFLSPLGAKSRNEPIFVKHVIEKIAQVKGKTFQEIADQTTDNARKLFRI